MVAAYHREALRKDGRLAHVVSHDESGEHDDYLELPEGQVMETVTVGVDRSEKTLRQLELPKTTGGMVDVRTEIVIGRPRCGSCHVRR